MRKGEVIHPQSDSIRRTRSGCWNCKGRRRRCTEERPACSGCVKRGLLCYYGIRFLWQDEAESMGIAFGRAGMKDRFRKKKKAIPTHYLVSTRPRAMYCWLNTTSDDIGCLYSDNELPQRQRVPLENQSPALPRQEVAPSRSTLLPALALHPSLSETDGQFFDYFSNVCTLRRSLINDVNPWRTVLLPLCHESQGLFHIAIAWAAHDLRNRNMQQEVLHYEDVVLQHKCRSLRYLQRMMQQSSGDSMTHPAHNQAERDAILLVIMLHCLLEIATGSVMEWTFHMKGAISIMEFYTQLSETSGRRRDAVFSPQVLELVHSFFSEIDTFLNTTYNDSGNHAGHHWSAQVQSMFPFLGDLSLEVSPCMGLSPELLDIISGTTSLAFLRRREAGNYGESIHQEFINLQLRLSRLKARPERLKLTGLISLHAAAFEEAALIYLHHAIHGSDYSTHNNPIHEVYLPRLLKILEDIHSIQGPLLGSLPYPMWALFIASCSASEEDRVKILEWFTLLKRNRPISNVPSTMAAVETIWKQRDLEADSTFDRSSRFSLGWEATISQLGWKMSLI